MNDLDHPRTREEQHEEPHLTEQGNCCCGCPDCVTDWQPMSGGGARRRCKCPDCAQDSCPLWRLDLESYEDMGRRADVPEGWRP